MTSIAKTPELLGQRPVWSEVLLGVTLLPFVFLLALVVLATLITIAPQLHNVAHNPMEDLMQNPRDAAIFGLGHVDQGWDAALAVGTLGAIWGTIYLMRRSIIAPMVSHAGFNLAQLVKFMALR